MGSFREETSTSSSEASSPSGEAILLASEGQMDFFREEMLDAASSSEGTSSSGEAILLASDRPKKRAGRRIFKETRHPVYRGVRRRNNNKWVCEMRVPNGKSRIWLGTYSTPEMAARAHDVAALALRGKSACLNFADSAWRVPLPESTNAAEIRRVAALAAQEFGEPTTTSDDYEVCGGSSSTTIEVIGDGMNAQDYRDKTMNMDEVPAVSEFGDLRHLLLSMAEEPLRSPPSFRLDDWSWNDVEIDPEVSLWQY